MLLIFLFLFNQPPPFGTVINQWRLNLAPYGGGVTWAKDNNSFYILTYNRNSHQARVYRFFPENPSLSYEIAYLNYPNLGDSLLDFFTGIAYNSTNRSLWHIQYLDFTLPAKCVAVKMNQIKADTFRFLGNPADTWQMAAIEYGIFGDFDFKNGIYYVPNQNSYSNWYLLDLEQKRVIGHRNLANLSWLAYFGFPNEKDTFWLLTSERNTNILKAYDTLGNLRRQASLPFTIIGGDIWEPENINLDSTVYIFLLSENPTNLYQVSLGLRWRDVLKIHDVAPCQIISPATVVDSATTIIPQIKIKNYGDFSESFPVYLNIGNFYFDTLFLNNLPPQRETILNFSSCPMHFRDSLLVITRTALTTDQYRQNDTLKKKIFVRVKDIGIDTLIVPETVHLGETLTFGVKIKNYGNSSSGSFTLRIYLDSLLFDQLTLSSLLPQEETLVTSSPWIAQPNSHTVTAILYLSGDMNPNNNQKQKYLLVVGIKEEEKKAIKEIFKIYEPTGRRLNSFKKKGIYFLKNNKSFKKIVIY
jgi:hypothetical protein